MGKKVQWAHEHLKCLVETCIKEIKRSVEKVLGMHKDSWSKLGNVLKEIFGMKLSQKEMKNVYHHLKYKYSGWVYLSNETRTLYNPQTNMFNLKTE